MTCKHFQPDHSTDLDGWGKCMQIESFKSRGASNERIEQVIYQKLTIAQRIGTSGGNYIFCRACCCAESGCEKFEEK